MASSIGWALTSRCVTAGGMGAMGVVVVTWGVTLAPAAVGTSPARGVAVATTQLVIPRSSDTRAWKERN